MAPAIVGAVAAGVAAATGLATGIAKIAKPGPPDPRQKMNPQGQEMADQLAQTFQNRVTGAPSLGQGLGAPNMTEVPAPNLNIGDIKQRLYGVGQSLGVGSPVGQQ